MKKLITIYVLLLVGGTVLAQENSSTIGLYGFIRSDFMIDSRQSVAPVEGIFFLYPKAKSLDLNGEDINANSSTHFSATGSRLGLNFSETDLIDGLLTAKVEFDFTGNDSFSGVRMRHAYLKMDWKKRSLLIGQTWHPMFTAACFPSTLNFSAATPFNPFNRSPQIRFVEKVSDNLTLQLASIVELTYPSAGVDGNNTKYASNAVLPSLDLQMVYKKGNITFGASVDYKVIQPLDYETSGGALFKSDKLLGSVAYMFFGKYSKDLFSLKGKAVYGQNMSHLVMNGGYAVSEVENGKVTSYTNSNNFNGWLDLSYGKTDIVGVVAAYSKSLGYDDDIYSADAIYGRGLDIDNMSKIAVRYEHWIKKKVRFGVEYDLTTAGYGSIDDDLGDIFDISNVANSRILFVASYHFNAKIR